MPTCPRSWVWWPPRVKMRSPARIGSVSGSMCVRSGPGSMRSGQANADGAVGDGDEAEAVGAFGAPFVEFVDLGACGGGNDPLGIAGDCVAISGLGSFPSGVASSSGSVSPRPYSVALANTASASYWSCCSAGSPFAVRRSAIGDRRSCRCRCTATWPRWRSRPRRCRCRCGSATSIPLRSVSIAT